MHHLFATLFALLFSFSQHTSIARMALNTEVSQHRTHISSFSFPVRHQVARSSVSEVSYPESECASCRGMNVSYTVR